MQLQNRANGFIQGQTRTFGGYMRLPNSDDILSISPDAVGDFIMHHANEKTLSRLVRRLNSDLLEGDETASAMAERALGHLGLMVRG